MAVLITTVAAFALGGFVVGFALPMPLAVAVLAVVWAGLVIWAFQNPDEGPGERMSSGNIALLVSIFYVLPATAGLIAGAVGRYYRRVMRKSGLTGPSAA
ncbi:MAG: hypothetical protein JHC95_14225 [Solirubrobacteraceae bacterium]|nr:hypothetical protein [Solirubrobacteraceae bacterium]